MNSVRASEPCLLTFELNECARSSKKSSLFNRVQLNWDKAILASNVALLTAGIAYAFFMRLPLVMAGLALYGIFYLVIYGKIKGAQSKTGDIYQLRSSLEVEKEKSKNLQERLTSKLSAKDITKETRQQIASEQKKVDALRAERISLKKKIRNLSAESSTLLAEVKAYGESLRSMGKP